MYIETDMYTCNVGSSGSERRTGGGALYTEGSNQGRYLKFGI